MIRNLICPNCHSECQYDDKSIWEGNRDMEDILCPVCDELLTRVFTDFNPVVILIKKGDEK